MKAVKKTLALILCLALCFSMTGMAQEPSTPPQAYGAEQENVGHDHEGEDADLAEASENGQDSIQKSEASKSNNADTQKTKQEDTAKPVSAMADDSTEPTINVKAKEDTIQHMFEYDYYCEAPSVTVSDDSGEAVTVTVNDKYSQEVENGGTVDLHEETGKITIKATDSSGNEASKDFAIDHYPGGRYEMTVEPTCTTDGKTVMYWLCKHCGESYGYYNLPKDPVKALGHEYDPTQSQTIDDVCGGEGSVTVSPCKRCGVMVKDDNTEYEATSGDSHTWGAPVTVAPTCVKAGYQYKECEICHIREKIEGSDTKPLIHRYGAWKITEPAATCGKQGKQERVCLNEGCTEDTPGHKQTETYIQRHEYASQRTTTKQATCESPGETGYKCKFCDSVYMPHETKPLGHDYAADGDCTKPSKCKRCQAELPGLESHNLSWRSDASGHWQECTNEDCTYSTKDDNGGQAYPHDSDANGDCTTWGRCQCGYALNPSRQHKLGEYKSDDNFHWQECTNPGCNYHTDKVPHSYDPSVVNDCTKDHICTVCQKKVDDAKKNHSWSDTYTYNITYHYRTCTTPGCTATDVKKEHTFNKDTNDCTKGVYCTECGYVAISGYLNHNYAGQPWRADDEDASRHYRECTNGSCTVREYAPHSGGTATCSSKAQCSECHAYYGEVNSENHTGPFETNRNYKAPTLMEKGYSGDKYCEACHTIVEKGHDLPALSEGHEHSYGEQQFNDVESWYECTICGYHDRVVHHTLGDYIYEDGTGHYKQCSSCKYKTTPISHFASESKYDNDCTTEVTCDDCGYVMVEKCDGHNFAGAYGSDENGHWQTCQNKDCSVTSQRAKHIENKDADCTTAVLCSVCGHTLLEAENGHNWENTWHSDAEGHYRKCLNIDCEAIDRHAHEALPDDGICTTPIVCKDCSYVMNDGAEGHLFGGDYLTNEFGHWRKCLNPGCTETEGITPHTGEATCSSPAVCTECGVTYGEKDMTNHVGLTEIRDHEDPTDTDWGYTGDVYCLGCDEMIDEGQPIEPLLYGHDHEWEDKQDDTHHWKECTLCGTWSDRTEHSMQWNINDNEHFQECTECGYARNPESHIFGYWETDTDGHWKTCETCGHSTQAEEHSLIWVRDEQGHYRECPTCGYKENVVSHNYGEWQHTDTGHFRTCADCGYVSAVMDHDFEWKADANEHYQVCRTCGYETTHHEHTKGALEHDSMNHWRTCEACGTVTDQAAHTYEGRWCTECGVINPDFVLVVGTDTDHSVEDKDSADAVLKSAFQDIISENGEMAEHILDAVDDGKEISVELSVTDKGSTSKEKKLDISIGVYADGGLLGNITEVDKPIEFAVPISGMKGTSFHVYREHNGKRTEIESRVEGDMIHFSSTFFSEFYIKAVCDLADAKVDAIPDQTYTGEAITPDVTVSLNDGTVLTKDVDYTLAYKDNIDEGTATIVITGINDYEGSQIDVTFRIVKESTGGNEPGGNEPGDNDNPSGNTPGEDSGNTGSGQEGNKPGSGSSSGNTGNGSGTQQGNSTGKAQGSAGNKAEPAEDNMAAAVKTGDDADIFLWMSMLGVSMALLAIACRKRNELR